MGFLKNRPSTEGDKSAPATISIHDLPNFEQDRTLLFGYTCERHTFHVFLKDGKIYRTIYNDPAKTVYSFETKENWTADELVPNKRVYPESTDEDFYKLMQECDVYVSFTNYDESYVAIRESRFGGFHGRHEL